MCNNSKNI
jgi:hypothetical protein